MAPRRQPRQALASWGPRLCELRSPAGFDAFLEAIGDTLRAAAIPFQGYRICTVDHATDPLTVRVRRRHPDGSWSHSPGGANGVLEPGRPFLAKPFGPQDLDRAVRRLLDEPAAD